ncbi:MAG TPA: D-amino acid aminotransferase [Gammaproteobacteria bacterium]|nr:D-amino acid aminotransferase [Gammaproteobacteria bacterium]
MSADIVYLNGEFLPADQAKVSVLDRGFVFGDGVYEVIPVFGNRLFRLEQHLDRLERSMAGIRLSNPMSREAWQSMLEELVERNADGTDQSVYLQVTRGVARRDHGFPDGVTPTVLAMCNPIATMDPEVAAHGVAAITLDDIRWQYCNIKAITLLPNILLRQQALDRDAVEAILVRDGLVTEGAASNVFVVRHGVLFTPPTGPRLLPGITRDLVVELARKNGIDCREEDIPVEALSQAEEIWLTSSTKEILPVTRLDDRPVGEGEPGPLWRRLYDIYQEYKRALREAAA